MKLSRRHFLKGATAAAVLPIVPRAVIAQTFPARPITVVVPFPAGGPADVIARILSERMRTALGQPVVVENVSGAGGSIGVQRVARATPDGYTLSIGQLNSHVFSGAAYSVSYDLQKDLSPIAPLTTNPQMLVGKKDLPAANMKELIAWLKANPDKASLATPGVGSPSHVWGVYFQTNTGTRFQFVPYRGGAPALQAIVTGQVDLAVLQASDLLPQVRNGNLRAYAILANTQWERAPEIPTVDQAGAPGLHMPFWHGIWTTANTPQDIVDKLHAAVVESLSDPALRQRFADIGQEIFPRAQQTPQALAALQKADIEKWWPVIKAANIRGE
jgi:tripartite-type tricarboxylate transporter receptor subunit TctC